MKAIVRTCWDICLLRQGPQVFPYSWSLFAVMLMPYMLADTILGFSQGVARWDLLFETLLDTAMLLVFFAFILTILGFKKRLNQTMVALLGTGTLLMCFNLPFLLLVDQNEFPYVRIPAYFVMIGLIIWSIAIMAHILRKALSAPNYLALSLAAFYQISNLLLLNWLFPVS